MSIAKLWNLKINLKMIIKKAGINFNNFGVTLNRQIFFKFANKKLAEKQQNRYVEKKKIT